MSGEQLCWLSGNNIAASGPLLRPPRGNPTELLGHGGELAACLGGYREFALSLHLSVDPLDQRHKTRARFPETVAIGTKPKLSQSLGIVGNLLKQANRPIQTHAGSFHGFFVEPDSGHIISFQARVTGI